MGGPVVAGGLPPLLPTPRTRGCIGLTPLVPYGSKKQTGRATLSENWIKDKHTGGGLSSDRSQESFARNKIGGGRESAYQNRGKISGGASLSSNWLESVEHASRPTRRDGWIGSKRAASRAPSADRSEKKVKPPTDEDDDVLESETQQYAGPTFVLSPDPSELPIPLFFLKAH